MKKTRRLKFKNRTPEHKKDTFFSRYQTKYRRRREFKTDYKLRKSLLTQDKTKYNARKYRLVIRKSNKYITAQLVYYSPDGDKILLAASSEELKAYGIDFGLHSYMAAYCVGLLFASRYQQKINTGGEQEGEENEEDDSAIPVADIGLSRITIGCNVLGVVKGAVDGGVNMNFNDKRSPGSAFDEDANEWTFDPNVWRKRCFGGSTKKAKDIGEEEVEKIVEKAHGEIRAEPFKKVADKKKEEVKTGSKKKNRVEKKKNKTKLKKAKVARGKLMPKNVTRVIEKLNA